MVDRGLTFTESTHRYRLDGKPVPSVTTILGCLDKPALPKWAAGQVAEFVVSDPEWVRAALDWNDPDEVIRELKGVPWQKRDDAAKRGTDIHAYAEDLLYGREVDVPPEHEGAVEAALQFMEDWGIEPVSIEQGCGSREHQWAGTWDLVADHNRGLRAIFDWKSGKRIYASAAFQLNAYAHSEFYGLDGDERETANLGIAEAYGVHIRDDGYNVHPLPFGPKIYDEFLVIRRVYDISKRAEGNYRRPGSGYVGLPMEATA